MKKSVNQLKIYGVTDTQAVVYKDRLINYIGGSNSIVFGGSENED